MSAGFSLLMWVDEDSSFVTEIHTGNQEHTLEKRLQVKQQLLSDACCLIQVRWNMDMTIHMVHGECYGYGNNSRFTVGQNTIRNALGDLGNHVKFLRSAPGLTLEELTNYKTCKEKWNVPDQVTESSSGWDQNQSEQTSTSIKRRRF